MSITETTLNLVVAFVQWLASISTAPAAPWVVGSLIGGYAAGAAKNRTAPAELIRAVFFGATAGGLVWLIQTYVTGGAA